MLSKPLPNASFLRTKPCRFFALGKGSCEKGNECRFSHETHDGRDAFQHPSTQGPSSSASATRPRRPVPPPPPPVKRQKTEKKELSSTADINIDAELKGNADSGAIVMDDDARDVPSQATSGVMHFAADGQPLYSVRETLETERSQVGQTSFMNPTDAVKLKNQAGMVTYRFPYEDYQVKDKNDNVIDVIQIAANADIVWCGMLYGRKEKVMQHLAAAMLLGYQLRTQVQPLLAAKRLRMANVLFVTEESLGFFEMSAVSHFWSIRAVTLPTVNQDRLRTVAGHLIDSVDPTHVFLKVEAWKMTAKVSVIADVDMMILNPDVMAMRLSQFVDKPIYSEMLTHCGTAVMQRRDSEVDFHKTPQVREQTKRGPHDHIKPLSYCWAVIRPSDELAASYVTKMAERGHRRNGPLSDQDLLSEVVANRYMELPHTTVMFPSWYNHRDINGIRAKEILRAMCWENFESIGTDDVEHFIQQFGAVHFSNVFNPYTTESVQMKREKMYAAGGGHTVIGHGPQGPIKNDVYTEKFLLPLWIQLRERMTKLQDEMIGEVTIATGARNPTPGLAKALVCLTAGKLKSIDTQPRPPSWQPPPHRIATPRPGIQEYMKPPWR